jgi:hypothetical protein
MELALALSEDADNPIVGDLRLRNGQLVWTSVLAEEVAQRLLVRFNFWRTEWFANLNAGMPWLSEIFEVGVDESVMRGFFTSLITGTQGVAALDYLNLTTDTESRALSLDFRARLQDGSTFISRRFGPFVVTIGT